MSTAILSTSLQAQTTDKGSGKTPDKKPAEVLPPWLKGFTFSGLIRFRPEFKYNLDFDNSADDVKEFVGQKVQIGVQKQFTRDITAKVVIQDSRVWGGATGSASGLNTANDNTAESTDIREAWLEVNNLVGPVSVQVGRQKLVYGDQRLVGHLDWTNVGRSFDGVRFKVKKGIFTSHVWGTVLGENDSDSAGNNTAATLEDAYFTGWYNTLKFSPQIQAEVYYLGIHKRFVERSTAISSLSDATVTSKDRSTQRDNLYTFGARLTNRTLKKGKKAPGPLDWSLEYAYQTGYTGSRVDAGWDLLNVTVPIDSTYYSSTQNPCQGTSTASTCRIYTEKQKYDAFAGAATLGFTIMKKFRIGGEYVMASGDPNSTDGSTGTFTNLFHTNHLHYGQADVTSWRNMVGRSVNMTLFMKKMGKLKLAYWLVNKHKRQDKWYAVTGAAKTGASTESSSNDISEVAYLGKGLFREIDLTYSVKWKGIGWQFGYSYVKAGDAITKAKDDPAYLYNVSLTSTTRNNISNYTPKSNPRADFGYIMMTYKF